MPDDHHPFPGQAISESLERIALYLRMSVDWSGPADPAKPLDMFEGVMEAVDGGHSQRGFYQIPGLHQRGDLGQPRACDVPLVGSGSARQVLGGAEPYPVTRAYPGPPEPD